MSFTGQDTYEMVRQIKPNLRDTYEWGKDVQLGTKLFTCCEHFDCVANNAMIT